MFWFTSVEVSWLRRYVRYSSPSCYSDIPCLELVATYFGTSYLIWYTISHNSNQFPALAWTCVNLLAPSNSSLWSPIIYPYTQKRHLPPYFTWRVNILWEALQINTGGGGMNWCPEVRGSGGKKVKSSAIFHEVQSLRCHYGVRSKGKWCDCEGSNCPAHIYSLSRCACVLV
jgi:hypothetical protein